MTATSPKRWIEEGDNYVYQVATNFVDQIEQQMEALGVSQANLATRLGKQESFVSRILRNPGNLTIRSMHEFAKAVGMGMSVVAYCAEGIVEPVGAEVLKRCWESNGRPMSIPQVSAQAATLGDVQIVFAEVIDLPSNQEMRPWTPIQNKSFSHTRTLQKSSFVSMVLNLESGDFTLDSESQPPMYNLQIQPALS